MFGLKALFVALGRLTSAVSHSAELFELANVQLERQLGLETEAPAQLPALEVEEEKRERRRR